MYHNDISNNFIFHDHLIVDVSIAP